MDNRLDSLPKNLDSKLFAGIDSCKASLTLHDRYYRLLENALTPVQRMDLYRAADTVTRDATALLLRHAGTVSINASLRVFGESMDPDEHAQLVMDNTGWHHAWA